MMRSPKTRVTLAVLSSLVLAATADAQERTLYESIDGWQVESSTSIAGTKQCVIVRNYIDEEDKDTDNAVTFGLENKSLVVVLSYSGWNYDKGDKFTAATVLGGKVVAAKSNWTAEGSQLVAYLPAALAEKAAASEEIEIKGKDWSASFDLHGVEDAFEAMRRCTAGEASQFRR